jgi:hypothetical protein
VLNKEYDKDRLANNTLKGPTAVEEQDAVAWWWRFFDLLLYEFDFWQRGNIREERFLEWMLWRWYDSHPKKGEQTWATCGVGYMQGWERWKKHPAHGNRLRGLLDDIHAADHPKKVPGIVNHYRRASDIKHDVEERYIYREAGEYLELATGRTIAVPTAD